MAAVKCVVLVGVRLRKRTIPETQPCLAPLTVGLFCGSREFPAAGKFATTGLACCGAREMALVRCASLLDEIDIDAAQSLQLYFFGLRQPGLSDRIPSDFTARALELVLYLLPYLKPGEDGYLREKLEIRNPSLTEGIRAVMLQQVAPRSRYSVLEHELRVVVALLRAAQTLTPAQLEQVETLLEPLWDYQSEN